MANKLKVGLLKEEEFRASQDEGAVTALIVNEEAEWYCSETIDARLQEELIKSGIFDSESQNVVVDGELAQTEGVKVVGEQIVSLLDNIIREHLKEVYEGFTFDKPLDEDALKALRKVAVLVKAFDCVKQETKLLQKWQKVITMEL